MAAANIEKRMRDLIENESDPEMVWYPLDYVQNLARIVDKMREALRSIAQDEDFNGSIAQKALAECERLARNYYGK